MHNILRIQYLQICGRVLMRSQCAPVASKRVAVATEVVPVRTRQVLIGYEPRLKAGFFPVYLRGFPVPRVALLSFRRAPEKPARALFSIAGDLALGIWSWNRHTVGNSLKRNQLGDS